MKRKVSADNGFTLVEIIVVTLILAILAGFAVPSLIGYIDKSRQVQYIAEAREFRQATTTMQVLIKGEHGKDLWDIGRVRTYYLEAANYNFTNDKQYKILHITCEGSETGGKLMWKQLTGKTYANRFFSDTRTGSFIGYIIIDRESNIIAGWFISEDKNYVITWGIKQKTSTTFHDSTNLVPSVTGSAATILPSEIDPSEDYRLYKRVPGSTIFEAA